MSGYNPSPSYVEPVIGIVRDLVAALRSQGIKSTDALRDLGPILGTTHRRIRTLFHRDREPVVSKHEWMSLRYRAGLFWLNEAARYTRLAEEAEERGNELVSSQMELPWETQDTTSLKQRRCA
jgi:hypothetical protein